MNNLEEALASSDVADGLEFHDGHLDAIFAFVGIALASISGKITYGI